MGSTKYFMQPEQAGLASKGIRDANFPSPEPTCPTGSLPHCDVKGARCRRAFLTCFPSCLLTAVAMVGDPPPNHSQYATRPLYPNNVMSWLIGRASLIGLCSTRQQTSTDFNLRNRGTCGTASSQPPPLERHAAVEALMKEWGRLAKCPQDAREWPCPCRKTSACPLMR
jgi:hypothetical protein